MMNFVTSALLGLLSFAAAAPAPIPEPAPAPQLYESYTPPNYTTTTASAGSSSTQTPFKFPISNGFPANTSDIADIEEQAHGTLPNGALPKNISDLSATTLGLIAFNEIFEVAFFTSLLYNVTNDVKGFELGYGPGTGRQTVINALTAVQAQEELHYAGANGILQSAGRTPIQPCEYIFPTSNFDDAIAIAATFTDVVLGALQDALNNFGTDGDTELLALIGSVIGQEGAQEGYFRSLEDVPKVPSALPFLTRVPAQFAFSFLNQQVVVSGSCPNINQINLPVYGALMVEPPKYYDRSQNLTFSFKSNGSMSNASNMSIVYINQQNVPVTEKIQNLTTSGGMTTFTAYFPYDEYELNDLTIAAVVSGTANFTSADAVANSTQYGPGVIVLN